MRLIAYLFLTFINKGHKIFGYNTMSKKEILNILRAYKVKYAEQYNIKAIGIFGSAARDETNCDSDIDVVLHIHKPDLFLLAGIKQELEEMTDRSVDVVA